MKIPYRLAQNPPQLARISFSAVSMPHLPQTDSHICEHGLYVWECGGMPNVRKSPASEAKSEEELGAHVEVEDGDKISTCILIIFPFIPL